LFPRPGFSRKGRVPLGRPKASEKKRYSGFGLALGKTRRGITVFFIFDLGPHSTEELLAKGAFRAGGRVLRMGGGGRS